MWGQLEVRLTTIIKPLFPDDAEFRRRASLDGLVFSVTWKLRNDPDRPNKRSRKIILVVSEEALEDYNDGNRNARERRIVNSVTERLKTFIPNHDAPYGQPEPEDQWVLT